MFSNLLCHMCMHCLLYILIMFDEWSNKCYVACIFSSKLQDNTPFSWMKKKLLCFIYNFIDTNELVNFNNDGLEI